MRAVVIREHGGPEVVRVEDLPIPEPGPGEARLRVHACGLNHIDLWLRRGEPKGAFHLPRVPGADFSGVVDAVGPGVDPAWVGREVVSAPQTSCGTCPACASGNQHLCRAWGIYGESFDGGMRELAVVAARGLFAKPPQYSHAECATLPLVFLTAWHMLVTRAQIRPGMTVLIHAAGSGVSSAGIQIAKLWGARVLTTAGSDEKLERARALGADHGINYATDDVVKRARELAGADGIDVVFDHVGADVFGASLKLLKRGGTFVTCGSTSGPRVELDLRHVFFRGLSILGSTMGTLGESAEIMRLVAQGRLRPVLDRTFPVEQIREAHEHLESRKAFGKVVVVF